jgi:hypothetical protein
VSAKIIKFPDRVRELRVRGLDEFAANGRMRNQYLNPDRRTQADMRAMRSRADNCGAAVNSPN